MSLKYKSELRRPYFPGHRSSYLELIPEEELEAFARLEDIDAPKRTARLNDMTQELDQMAAAKEEDSNINLRYNNAHHILLNIPNDSPSPSDLYAPALIGCASILNVSNPFNGTSSNPAGSI